MTRYSAAPIHFGAAFLFSLGMGIALSAAAQAQEASAERGAYVFHASGCETCHTDSAHKGEMLAGGRALKTPFGTFYTPNITPDPTYGIGKWSEQDFIRAVREGVAPDGSQYFPAFPYTSYTKMSDGDVRDLYAYVKTLPPVAKPSKPHDVGFPFNVRLGVVVWKWLNFTPGPLPPVNTRSAAAADETWMRGRYLVEALGHCAECHTPRDRLGGLKTSLWMAGSDDGAEGESAPNITPDPQTGIGEWSDDDIAFALKIGMTPDGDSLGSLMAEVVEHGTSKLTDEDLAAMAAYLKALPPIVNKPGKPAAK
ncbi:MAG TPA: cytochrome c [Alphaproteobacteria bacterium]